LGFKVPHTKITGQGLLTSFGWEKNAEKDKIQIFAIDNFKLF